MRIYFGKGRADALEEGGMWISLWGCLWSGSVVAANGSRGPAILRILVRRKRPY